MQESWRVIKVLYLATYGHGQYYVPCYVCGTRALRSAGGDVDGVVA
jgi:hypothetical protein